jgi:hypothetical protein
MCPQVCDAPQARDQPFFRTGAGRDVRVRRTTRGDTDAPGPHVSLHIGHTPDGENGAGATLTPGEARQLAAALLQQAAGGPACRLAVPVDGTQARQGHRAWPRQAHRPCLPRPGCYDAGLVPLTGPGPGRQAADDFPAGACPLHTRCGQQDDPAPRRACRVGRSGAYRAQVRHGAPYSLCGRFAPGTP